MKKIFFIWLTLLVGCLAVFIFLPSGRLELGQVFSTNNDLRYEERIVKIGNQEVAAEVADTGYKKQLGLSGRKSLAAGRGMLFIYDSPETPGFWMKEMNFNIDIIWLYRQRIVDITPNVSRDNQEIIYYPKELVTAVLEVPANFASGAEIAVGDTVEFKTVYGGR